MLVLDQHIAARRAINNKYREMLKDAPGISFLENPNSDFESNMWLTCIIVDSEKAGYSREDLRLRMEAANIETRPLWKPMHLQPVFSEYPFYGDGTSEHLFNNGLCLPSHPALSEENLAKVVGLFMNISN